MDPFAHLAHLAHLALTAGLLQGAHGRALNCTASGNQTGIELDGAAGFVTDDLFNATTATNGTCADVVAEEGNDLGMVKVGVLTAVLVVVMISTCRLLFKMYAQFGMRDSPDGTDKAFGE